ncbi:MAG: hypothetical protein R2764_05590 [Bacteroidales bacterium]
MKTKVYLVIVFAILYFAQLSGQTFEEYKQQRQSEMQAMKQKQQEFMKEMQNEFDEYVEQRDAEFASFLEKRWEEFSVMRGVAPPDLPKPPDIPEYTPDPEREKSWEKVPVIQPTLEAPSDRVEEIRIPLILKSDEANFEKSAINIKFFGIPLSIDYDARIKLNIPGKIDEASISNYWKEMSNTNYNALIGQFQEYKNLMNLNSYAYYLMLQNFTETIYPESETGADLMLWALMNRSGYKSRLAYYNNKVCLLLPSNYTIYSRNFMESGGMNYYLMKDIGSNSLFTYDRDYPDANQVIDFSIKSPFNFPTKIYSKPFNFTYKGTPYTLNVNYNQYLINFYKDYPQVDLNIYFDAAVSSETKESIIEGLKPLIINLSETEALNLLLKFVQTSFNYQVDEAQFQKEKFFFPEEVFYYPYSDCEDRSVLFAYLVKELLNLKVVGIEYPGHIATAVKVNGEAEGDYFMYKGEKYIMADPTFENAPLGMTMPDYRGVEGKIVELSSYNHLAQKAKSYWDKVMKAGGYHGNILRDIVFDDNGNAYLTGYLQGDNKLEQTQASGETGASLRSAFLAKYDKGGNLIWVKTAKGDKNATGYTITLENNRDLYIAGSFSGNLSFGDGKATVSCLEDVRDVFLARYSTDGQFIWAQKAGLDTYPQDNYLSYMIKFTKDGLNKGTSFFSEQDNVKNFGLQSGPMGLLYLTGSFMNTTGVALAGVELTTRSGQALNLPESLKAETDKLIADNYNSKIAGLFAVMNHVKYNGISVAGNDAQIALDTYNPEFKKKYPDVYNSILNVQFMVNDDGIIKMETKNGDPILFDKLKVTNNSTVKITSFEDGNVQVDVLSGIKVGKLMIWFDLNFVKLYKLNGDLLVDYDSDHSQKLINITDDILD